MEDPDMSWLLNARKRGTSPLGSKSLRTGLTARHIRGCGSHCRLITGFSAERCHDGKKLTEEDQDDAHRVSEFHIPVL